MKKIILFQPASFHVEVLRPQLDFLFEEFDVTILTTRKVSQSDTFRTFHKLNNIKFSTIPEIKDFPLGKYLNRIARFIALLSLVIRKSDYIVFNTLSKRDLFFSSFLKYRTNLLGIVHNAEKFSSDKYKKLRQNFKKLIVLSDEVFEYCQHNSILNDSHSNLSWFIPLSRDLQNSNNSPDFENSPKILIGIIGSVSQERRDYASLWKSLEDVVSSVGNPEEMPFRIVLAGKMNKETEKNMSVKIKPLLEYSTEFLSFEEINRKILSCHILSYLIHPGMKYANTYNKTKITGTSTVLKSIKRIPLSSDFFNIDRVYKDTAFLYKDEKIEDFLFRIINGEITISKVKEIYGHISIDKYSFESQKQQYLNLFN